MPRWRTWALVAAILAASVPLAMWLAPAEDETRGVKPQIADAAQPPLADVTPARASAGVRAVVAGVRVRPALRRALRARVRAAARPVSRPALPADVPVTAKAVWSPKARRHARAERRALRRSRRINPAPSRSLWASSAGADTEGQAEGAASTADSGTTMSALAATGIVSDEFNGPALDTSIWTLVNPLGDAAVSMTGSQAQLTLPAGVRHDLWTNADEAPRLIQAAPNTDFEVEAKWDTGVTQGYHLQGLVVQQDADDLLRVEVHNTGWSTHLFVARIAAGQASVVHFGDAGGSAPVYMRLARAGSSWTVRLSQNGTTWNTAATFNDSLTVTGIGPFAGNSGAEPPAFTSRIDYFRVLSAVAPDPDPPAISGISASPSGIGAVVEWQTDEAATSSVAYGTTTAYTGGLVSRQARVSSHSLTLAGLACGTLYHYEVRSRDAAGNESLSGDRTFTTAACPASVSSDEFNGTSLNRGVWTFVDPVGDVGTAFTGSHAELALPAGSRHDLWTNTDEVPKLLQAAPNTDFEVEAKWDSWVTQGFHLQGIVVVQDADDMLRIEAHHDGSGSRLFVARVANGVATTVHHANFAGAAPMFFRLKREGSTWTLRTSANGATWTTRATFSQTLNVTAIGPFAGNSGFNPPAFTSRIDYFRDVPPDLTPPAISAIAAQPTGVGATVTFATNEPGTSEIRYGRTTSYESGTVSRPDLVSSHAVSLYGLACGTQYHYQVRSRDAAGNLGTSPDRTITTAACPEHIESDEFNAAALDTGLWTHVDPMGDTSLTLGGGHARFALPAGARHDLWTGANEVPRLLQAAPDTNFEVEAKFDSAVTSGYQIQGILVQQDTDDLLRIETHHDGTETFLFVASIAGGTATTVQQRPIPASASFWLRVARVGNTWTVRFSRDGAAWATGATFNRTLAVTAVGPFGGNSGGSPPAFDAQVDYFREITDRIPPQISDLVVSPRTNSVVLTWTTDEPATSQVVHGTTTSYGQTFTDSKLVTRHWVRVPGLSCQQTRHLQVRSRDALDNEVASTDRTFTTGSCAAASAPDIDVWGGDTLRFGTVGAPQQWVNVTGSVYDPQGVSSVRATLNGRSPQNITIGPDDGRLERPGDFNVELNRELLFPGDNKVVIEATDTAGNTATKTVTVDWRGDNANPSPPANGPVLVVVAHGDDALLGAAGVIRANRLAGRRVVVAATTNGDQPQEGNLSGYCGAAAGNPATTAAHGLELSRETMTAVGLLGLSYSTNLSQTGLIFLGYPNHSLVPIAEAGGAPWVGPGTELGRTYGEDGDSSNATCNGDLRYLLSGQHSPLTSTALAADFDSLLQTVQPTDIYTLVDFDGHPDHAEVGRQVAASVRRLGVSVRVHGTVVHPHGSDLCMGFSAENWPNPARVDTNPLSRFTPTIGFEAPPIPTCGAPAGFSWGPFGSPTEWIDVPPEMQLTNPQQNLKLRTLDVWDTQCPPNEPEHVTCGYFYAFAKKNEFFWNWTYSGRNRWPQTYTANWTSTATISDKAQVVEGEWTYDAARDGVRPLATGFDRVLTLGETDWRSYEITLPVTMHWFDQTKPSAGIGLIMGWKGHTPYGGLQPRLGHPYGGLCGFGRSFAEPALPRMEIIRNVGEIEDTIQVAEDPPRSITLGAAYTMRFRRADLGNGNTRYSCKMWKSDTAEPGGWDLETTQPDQLDTSARFRGSAILMAHNVDVTFGDVQITPVAP